MPNTNQAPRIKFFQNHRPQMVSGDYYVSAERSIFHEKIPSDTITEEAYQFSVSGERYMLSPGEISSIFPAAGSTGAYIDILPHIILKRKTLPWERLANPMDEDTPWLALLMFDEDEIPEKKIISVKDLQSQAPGSGFIAPPEIESGQDENARLTVIDLSKDLLEKVLPSTESLKLQAHTREGINAQEELVGSENAVVFCNRIPSAGKRSTIHLCSLEGLYDANGFVYAANETLFRLVSLKSWDFYSLEHFKITSQTLGDLDGKAPQPDLELLSTLLGREFAGTEDQFLEQVAEGIGLPGIPEAYRSDLITSARFSKTFDGLLTHLNRVELTLRLPMATDSEAEKYLSQGLVPLQHSLRNGDRTVSFYRGAFVPTDLATIDGGMRIRALLPETADELLRYDADKGLFDATYAAAWELGRLLALGDRNFSRNLYRWKRERGQSIHRSRQQEQQVHLPVFAHSNNDGAAEALWNQELKPWLSKLARLENVPGNYLVPSEGLLPQESIRFFEVDQAWVVAALLGAFSIGGGWDHAMQTEDNDFNQFLDQLNAHETGFLLRSDVIEGWPGLHITGFDNFEFPFPPRRRSLAPGMLICLFPIPVEKVTFQQNAEVLHLGFLNDNGAYSKDVRDESGDVTGNVATPLPADRVYDMHALAQTLQLADAPARFALNMVEGVPEVVFNVDPHGAVTS